MRFASELATKPFGNWLEDAGNDFSVAGAGDRTNLLAPLEDSGRIILDRLTSQVQAICCERPAVN